MKAAALAIALAAPAQAADFHFCWLGANDYALTGQMTITNSAMGKALVTEADVTRFAITGYYRGSILGTWDMADRAPKTTWHLRFDPVRRSFLTGGSFRTDSSQGWNADGNVMDCGNPGFGFNSGNYAQDLCVNGVWMTDSSIDPATPFLVQTEPVTPDCKGIELIG